jgi:hypothetical protein
MIFRSLIFFSDANGSRLLPAQEAEIRRMEVQSQPEQIGQETLFQK